MNDSYTEHSVDAIKKAPNVSIYHGQPHQQKSKKRTLKLAAIILTLLFVSSITYVITKANQWSNASFVGQKNSLIGNALDLIRGSTGEVPLAGEKTGTVNVLLLGIGGEGHDGPYLSDTIVVAQLNLNTNEVALTAIPRDYQVKLPNGGGYRKINAAFAEGYYENNSWEEAGKWAMDAAKQVSGLDLSYFAVIDFGGFEEAIDQVGGLDIEVKRTFTDYQYPNKKEGYLPPQTFSEGTMHLDGAKALVFARSRHAAGPEGSDFSRSQRQQQIMDAFRNKVQKLNLLTDSGQITSLLRNFASHFHTNITPGQLVRLAKIGKHVSSEKIIGASLDPETGLVCPSITEDTKAYVLTPCYGVTISEIHNYFKNAISIGKLAEEKSVVWVATSNPKSTSYRRLASQLQSYGVTVWPINYTEVEPDESAMYQVNQKPATAEFLKNLLKAREVTLPPPNIKIDSTRSDIVVILGSRLPQELTKPLPPPSSTPIPTPTQTPTPSPTSKQLSK